MSSRLGLALLLVFAAACAKENNEQADAAAPSDAAADAGRADSGGGLPDATETPDAGIEPYTVTVFDNARISSHGEDPNFQHVRAELDFKDAPFAEVKMILSLATTCYPFESWQQNPPPPGENWPADCDAFDRNFEVTLDPARTATDAPGIELVRAITPFGGPLEIEVDVTDIANGLPGPHRVDVNIPTYSDGAGQVSGSYGGWNVSLRFEVTPGTAPRNVLAVIPLVNFSHDANTATVAYAFTTPPDTESARIEYRVTGHGGGAPVGAACIGPAEEFCRRLHRVYVDGTMVHHFDAWRDDCETLCTLVHFGSPTNGFDYCMENPCGAIGSVRAPRANWCPGSVTPPQVVEADELSAPGPHAFEYTIDTVLPGGVWRISATFIAIGP